MIERYLYRFLSNISPEQGQMLNKWSQFNCNLGLWANLNKELQSRDYSPPTIYEYGDAAHCCWRQSEFDDVVPLVYDVIDEELTWCLLTLTNRIGLYRHLHNTTNQSHVTGGYVTYPYDSVIGPSDWYRVPPSLGSDVTCDGSMRLAGESMTSSRLRWLRNFSSRRHFARLLENQTCIRVSGRSSLCESRSRAKTSG